MTRLRLVPLLVSVAGLGTTWLGAEESAPISSNPSAVVQAPSPRPRVVSPETAALLAASIPKYVPPAPKTAEPAPDLRETDKPRNGIVRLPPYFVRESHTPVFKDRDLFTPKATLALALKRFPGLWFNPLFFLRSNDGIALMMLHEEQRLEDMADFNDLVRATSFTDPKTGAKLKRAVDTTFMREPFSRR